MAAPIRTTTPGTAVAPRPEPQPKGLGALVTTDAARAYIEPFLPPGTDMRRVAATVQLAERANPQLAQCDKASLVLAVAKIQQWGLEIGETAHLVPFKGKVTPVADYKGIAHLLRQSGAVRHIEARCVYAGDEFEYEQGLNPVLRHVPTSDVAARGALVGAYVILRLPFGQSSFEFMHIADIEAIRRQYSKQWGPDKVKECPPWYAKKTVVRQASKLLPKSGKLADALKVIDDDAAVEFEDAAPPTVTARLADEDRIEAPEQPDASAAEEYAGDLELDDEGARR